MSHSSLELGAASASGAVVTPGPSRYTASCAYWTLVDRLLPLFGTGPVLDLGQAEPVVFRAWRQRGIDCAAIDVTKTPFVPLPHAQNDFNAMVALHVLEHVPVQRLDAVLAEIARVVSRCVFVQVSVGPEDPAFATGLHRTRAWWETKFLQAGFAKHTLYQRLTSFNELEHEGPSILMAFERLPSAGTGVFGLDVLRAERDLHMDMLRETGRRADAHVARYAMASEFVRPRDRVLDAACGLGYGAAFIHDGTRAETVTGIDNSRFAVDYANAIFATRRPRLNFVEDDVQSIAALPDGSADMLISFETLEHIADPAAFVADAARVLTPGGRFICSVPNQWVDETGHDPNPYHLHVFDLPALLALFGSDFHLERVFGQTAGGGMKHHASPRSLVDIDPSSPVPDPEWWLVVAMRTPLRRIDVPFREPESMHPDSKFWTVTAFEREYDNPWLVRSLVTQGFRASSSKLLRELADSVSRTAAPSSPDAGAALCVEAYTVLASGETPAPELMERLDAYCARPDGSPHVERWRISNEYVLARLHLAQGLVERAEQTFGRCANRDCLRFGPLLATKTVDAAFWAGWLAFQRGDHVQARTRWIRGVEIARGAAGDSWTNVIGSVEEPLLFGLRELTTVMDLASRCASGLHALGETGDAPGLVAAQTFFSMGDLLLARERDVTLLRAERATLTQALSQASAENAWRAGEMEQFQQRARDSRQAGLTAMRAMRDSRGVAIFGAGEGGRRVAARWVSEGGRLACFVDNRREVWDTQIADTPVVAPLELTAANPSLVLVASSTGYTEIAAQLEQMGMRFINGLELFES
jgi:SAM-dependent methyltransferase